LKPVIDQRAVVNPQQFDVVDKDECILFNGILDIDEVFEFNDTVACLFDVEIKHYCCLKPFDIFSLFLNVNDLGKGIKRKNN
jgi:hypothetical protein